MTRIFKPGMAEVNITHGQFMKLFEDYAVLEKVELELNEYLPSHGKIALTLRPMVQVMPNTTDEELRTLIFWQMQECLRILGNNGYKVVGGPIMEIRGEPLFTLDNSVAMTEYNATLEVIIEDPDWKTKTGRKL